MPAGSAIKVRITGSSRADENCDSAKTLEEPLRHLQLMLAQENVRTVSLNQRPAAIIANLIGNHRAKIAADSASGGRPETD